jgi:hypothetical protein
MRLTALRLAALALAALALAGCATTTALTRSPGALAAGQSRVLLMPPDVELSELTAGGLLEPKAEWTARAQANVTAAIQAVLETRKARLVPYRKVEGDGSRAHQHAQLVKLHDAVGGAILLHKYGPPPFQLPTKDKTFDWTLGAGAAALRASHDADYALFVFFRDSYASSGRVALIVGAALLGVGVPAGQQMGFASLVELTSGDIVWFNRLVDPAGDLRTLEPTRKAVDRLLAELPL